MVSILSGSATFEAAHQLASEGTKRKFAVTRDCGESGKFTGSVKDAFPASFAPDDVGKVFVEEGAKIAISGEVGEGKGKGGSTLVGKKALRLAELVTGTDIEIDVEE